MSEVCEEQSKSQQDIPMKGKCNSGEMSCFVYKA